MKCLRLLIVSMTAILFIGLVASSAAAFDGIKTATVNFGMPDPGTGDETEVLDHKLLPEKVIIKSFEGGGGIVNYIVSGSRRHRVGVYKVSCWTKLKDIKAQLADPANFDIIDGHGNLILQIGDELVVDGYIDSDPNGYRYYHGPNPQLPPVVGTFAETDRIEPVLFVEPGCYLVVCLRQGHLRDGMVGLVVALP